MISKKTLETLNFDNLTLRSLPIDAVTQNSVRQVPNACFSLVSPAPVKNPQLVACSVSALDLLDIDPSETKRKEFVEYFSGNQLLPGSQTAAHCYCGHQFGFFSGQLGDGAAMYLGEVVNARGERWELQLKGAGPTPYSRQADGRKVLRSSIREFLCSEAMFHLGVPTTRAGTCLTSDSTVVRDVFYTGNPIQERCTIVSRIAPTFIRFGSFEIFKDVDRQTARKGPSHGRADIHKQLLDHVVRTYYPEIWTKHESNTDELYAEFFTEVVRRTAYLVAQWQCVGFCHGVLNTDNMSIVGVTIDYGPFGFMDRFDPDFICNASDDGGRYTYSKQPSICQWNCDKLAEALAPLLPIARSKVIVEEVFDVEYRKAYLSKMRLKFGLINVALPDDETLVDEFLSTMAETGADFSNSFHCLNQLSLPGMAAAFDVERERVIAALLAQCSDVEELQRAFTPDIDMRQFQMLLVLFQTNPDAFGQELGYFKRTIEKLEKLKEIKNMSQSDWTGRNEAKWRHWLLKYTERLRGDEEAARESGRDLATLCEEKRRAMERNNARFVLRNYIAQRAIDMAEKGDFSEVERVLKLIQDPYALAAATSDDACQSKTDAAGALSSARDAEQKCWSYECKPPDWALGLKVT